ncbi:MAG: CheY-like chemotaxis protein/anti-sigma regulatory factor (Ser/Thr protein kinase) [Myxococcota bacterium]|jgi:CheY-like chemotaxis protein/anti-sigma regulatory factor (Ser/Thr protein kinase)
MTENARGDRLAELNAVGDILTGFAHDLNNPLAGILGYCHLLRGESDPVKVLECITHIRQQAEACRDLVASLQECVVTGEHRPSSFLVRDLVDAMLMFGAPVSAKVQIVSEVAPDLSGFGDADGLRRALSRLVTNAATALGTSGGVITIRAAPQTDEICLSVIDHGTGFAEHVIERAFDPTATSRRSGSGVGFGLPTALHIAQRNGGDVRIVESRPGHTEVALVFPAGAPAAVSKTLPAASLVVVDDERLVLELVSDMAEALGHRAATARTANDALAALNGSVKAIVVDAGLPDQQTETLYLAVREHHPELVERFVLSTAAPNSLEADGLRKRYGLKLLRKPFSIDDLRAAIGDL